MGVQRNRKMPENFGRRVRLGDKDKSQDVLWSYRDKECGVSIKTDTKAWSRAEGPAAEHIAKAADSQQGTGSSRKETHASKFILNNLDLFISFYV